LDLEYKMASTDELDQEIYVGTGGYGRGHSAAFTAGYNCGFGGWCQSDLYRQIAK